MKINRFLPKVRYVTELRLYLQPSREGICYIIISSDILIKIIIES